MPLQFLSPIHKASRQIGLYLEKGLIGAGLTPGEGHLISYLRSYSPSPVGELLRVFGHKRSTLTSILDRLSERQLVRRETDPRDRRVVLVRITAKGRRQGDRIQRRLEEFETAVRARLRSRDLEGFRRVMGAIAAVTEVELKPKEDR